MFTSVPGFQYLAITEPAVKKSYHRVAWAQFADDVDVNEVVAKLDNYKVRSILPDRITTNGRLTPSRSIWVSTPLQLWDAYVLPRPSQIRSPACSKTDKLPKP